MIGSLEVGLVFCCDAALLLLLLPLALRSFDEGFYSIGQILHLGEVFLPFLTVAHHTAHCLVLGVLLLLFLHPHFHRVATPGP